MRVRYASAALPSAMGRDGGNIRCRAAIMWMEVCLAHPLITRPGAEVNRKDCSLS